MLNLPVGTNIQLELDSPKASPRFLVPVIGYVPKVAIIVATPSIDGKVQIVRDGQRYNVRMLQGESVVGFKAKVLHSAVKPYPHLHLEYPKEMEQIVVRNAVRVNTSIACMVRNTKHEDAREHYNRATITDLSESGAKIVCKMPLAEQADMVQVNFRLKVLGDTEDISLIADVMNSSERVVKDDEGKRLAHYCGVKFRGINRFQMVLLHAWVMEMVTKGGQKL